MRNGAEKIIASFKSLRLVDLAEILKVEHDNRKLFFKSLGARNFMRDGNMKIPLVVDAGEAVSVGDATEFFSELHVLDGRCADIARRLSDGAVVIAESIGPGL